MRTVCIANTECQNVRRAVRRLQWHLRLEAETGCPAVVAHYQQRLRMETHSHNSYSSQPGSCPDRCYHRHHETGWPIRPIRKVVDGDTDRPSRPLVRRSAYSGEHEQPNPGSGECGYETKHLLVHVQHEGVLDHIRRALIWSYCVSFNLMCPNRFRDSSCAFYN